jgi:EamA domain-containing membrane protein RarD
LAWRILLTSAGLVLLYSLVSSKQQWVSALPSAERGLDLAIASVIVGIFLFARYYAVSVDPAVRTLALGFFLFSCFGVLNNTILERWLYDYVEFWNILGMLAFLAALLLWTWALRLPQTVGGREEVLLPNAIYSNMSPAINLRLRLFNEQLSRFWKVEAGRS